MEGKINVIELFAGAGGLAQGFIKNKIFNLLGLMDIDYSAEKTFKRNYPDIYYEVNDICKLSPKQFYKKIGSEKIHGIIGGPPCQGFSAAGKRDIDDKRNLLALEYLKFVEFFQPDFVVLENVPQFLKHNIYKDIALVLSKDYNLSNGVLNAAFYGSPQTRVRSVIIGFRKTMAVIPTLPPITHAPIDPLFGYRSKKMVDPKIHFREIVGMSAALCNGNTFDFENKEKKIYKPFVNVESAIGDLPSLKTGDAADIYLSPAISDYQILHRGRQNILYNHMARQHDYKICKLFESLPEGGDLQDLEKCFHPAKHFSQAYSRLHRFGLARTITNSFQNPGSGRFTHYKDNRTLTVREAARLQGFSDDFIFEGNISQQLKQVGNAVPIPLAEAIANHITFLLKHISC